MSDIVDFGKYKGKTFKDVERDIGYCNWVLSVKKTFGQLKQLQNYLQTVDFKIPKGQVNCSYISVYYCQNKQFMNLIKDLQIKKTLMPTLECNGLPSNLKGQFIDYYIRYKISQCIGIPFRDNRCEIVTDYHSLWDVSKKDIPSCYLNSRDTFDILIDQDTISDKFNEDSINLHFTDDGIVILYGETVESETNFNSSHHETSSDKANKLAYLLATKRKIYQSYSNVRNGNSSLNDLLNVSISHSLFFAQFEHIQYIDYFLETPEMENDKFDKYVRDMCIDLQPNDIKLNPTLGNSHVGIQADADLIIGDALIDFKCSSYDIGKNHFVQLFIYHCLNYINNKHTCNKLIIINPILGIQYEMDISEWKHIDDMIQLLKMRQTNCDK